jgi:cytochrome c biogenesis protein CcdA
MAAMLRLIGLMISIGFADSLNPSTIAPALYMATGQRNPRRQVMQFTLGVFAVYLIGGLAVALGPGELVLDLVPHPRPGLKYLFEIIGGVVLLTLAGVLWAFRTLLAKRELPEVRADSRSSLVLGATITALELPTAFPYFAAIAAVVGSGFGIWHQVFLILIFNVTFVLPLLAIVLILQFAGPNADRVLTSSRRWLERHWPVALAVVGLVAGTFCVFIGITGLIGLHHTHTGRVARKIRGIVAR